MGNFLKLAALAVLAMNIVTANSPPPRAFVDTFEDKPPSPPAPGGTGNPVGIENGLLYQSWDVGTASPSVTNPGTFAFGGVIPKSPKNVAVTAAAPQALNNTVAITAIYPGSNVTKFDLQALYFGCSVVTANSVAGIAAGCVLSVSGYYPNGAMIPGYTMSFGVPLVDTSTIAPLPMQYIVFPLTFYGVKTVLIQLAAFGGPNSEVAFYDVDNVAHINYYS